MPEVTSRQHNDSPNAVDAEQGVDSNIGANSNISDSACPAAGVHVRLDKNPLHHNISLGTIYV